MRFRRPAAAVLLCSLFTGGILGTSIGVAPSSSAASGAVACLPVNGLATGSEAQARAMMNGYVTIPGYKAVYIGTTGNVNWGMDPFKDQSWRRLFLSLKWVEMLTTWSQRRPSTDADMLVRAKAIAANFAAHNPAGGGPRPADAWTGMYAGQRATTFTCIDYLSRNQSWVRSALAVTGTWLNNPANDPGSWNQGVDTYIGLLAAGCVYGSSAWISHASQRLDQLVSQTINADGSVNEQAPGYGEYLDERWAIAESVLTECGQAIPTNLASRLTALLRYLAWSTEPSGQLAQLGDTTHAAVPLAAPGVIGSPLEWAASHGTQGTAPSDLFALFANGGYGFGRSTWNPDTAATWYVTHWGPGRNYHGHDDHESVLLDAFSHQILVDSGHWGYTPGAYRDYLVSPYGHNVLTMPGVAFNHLSATSLTRQAGGASWHWYEMSDTAWGSRARIRDLFVDTHFPLVIAYDRSSRYGGGAYQQLWHLAPGTHVTISGRSAAWATSSDGRVRTLLVQIPLAGQVLPAGSTAVVTGRTTPSYQGWVSYTQGARTAAPTVVMSRSGAAAAMLTVIVPAPSGTAQSVGVVRRSDGSYALTVHVGGAVRVVYFSPGGPISG